MPASNINIGTLPNDGTGESLRSFGSKVNTNNAYFDAALAVLTAAVAVTGRLKEMVSADGYELTAITYDSDGVVTTATVLWPDGSAGTFTTVTKNATFLTIDAFTVTHTTSGKTITQALVTRSASGQVTVKPALTITP